MTRLFWVLAAACALAACDPKGPPPPSPKTAADQAMRQVVASTPASDPSLPNQAEIAAAQPTEPAPTAMR